MGRRRYIFPQGVVVRFGHGLAARRCACSQSDLVGSAWSLRDPRCTGVRVMALMGRKELLEALSALDEELGRLSVRGEVFVVGGAAMAIAYDTRRATADVDAVFAPSSEVREAAARVAGRLHMAPDWLNDGAKAFMPGDDENRIGVYEGKNLSVAAASPEFLLAMKLMASRVERDQDDIRELYRLCGFTNVEQGLDLLTSFYPDRVILPRVQFLLQEMFPRSQERGRDNGVSH